MYTYNYSMSSIDLIMEDSEIAEIHEEIKKILDAIEVYSKKKDSCDHYIESTKRSALHQKAELRKTEKEYKCHLDECINLKQSSDYISKNTNFLKCAGYCQELKKQIQKLDNFIDENKETQNKLSNLIDNYENQLEIKREELVEKLKKYLN